MCRREVRGAILSGTAVLPCNQILSFHPLPTFCKAAGSRSLSPPWLSVASFVSLMALHMPQPTAAPPCPTPSFHPPTCTEASSRSRSPPWRP